MDILHHIPCPFSLSQAMQSCGICMMHFYFICFSIYGHNISKALKHMLRNGFMTTIFQFHLERWNILSRKWELIPCLIVKDPKQ